MKKIYELWQQLSWPIHAILASLFWGGIGGLISVWPALASVVPLPVYVGGMVIMSAALAAAKHFHRPGTE